MAAHALPRSAAVFVESSFVETQSDWDANATEIFVVDPNVEAVSQQLLDNENIRPRRMARHAMIPGLKSDSTYSCGIYMHGKGVSAAEGAATTASIQATLLKSCVGGLDLGWAAGIASGDVTNPVLDADPGIADGDWGFFFDTSAGVGEFGRIESISTVTLTQFWDLSFTPDAGGADVMHAVIDLYPNGDALDNHADANHTTLGWKVQGQGSDDVYELRGCKPAMGEIAVTAGEPVMIELAHKVVDWAQTPAATTFTSAPSGEAPNVPGRGSTCSVKLGDFGGALANVIARGTVSFTPGIDWEADKGPNGTEGVHGYVATGVEDGARLEIIVDYSPAYDDEFEAGTFKHCLIQVGNTPTTAWGIYCARLEYAAKPVRIEQGGLTSVKLRFVCHEDTASVSGVTGDNIDKRRAPWHLLIAA